MTECRVESSSLPQLPLAVLIKMASMLQSVDFYGDRLQLAAVSRQLRQAVLSSIQRIKPRWMWIGVYPEKIWINGVNVNKRLCSQYSQIDCIGALLAFGQPNSIVLNASHCNEKFLKNVPTLMCSLPLSLTSFFLVLTVDKIGTDSRFDQILKVVASLTSLETLRICVNCSNESAAATHQKGSPSVPKSSPFNHLLTLKNLRALRVESGGLLSPAQKADLLNRSSSNVTHICCSGFDCAFRRFDVGVLLATLCDQKRSNIVSICCFDMNSFHGENMSRLLAALPKCRTIHCSWSRFSRASRENFEEFGGRLVEFCSMDSNHRGQTLECNVGCDGNSGLEQELEVGEELQIGFTFDNTVVRLSIGAALMME